MLSMPAATMTSASPHVMAWVAMWVAFMLEPHSLLTVTAGTSSGSPAACTARRPGLWPWPACSTLPTMTSSISAGSSPARLTASAMAMPPSFTAGISDRAPRKRATGVRQALKMTVSRDKMRSLVRLSPFGWLTTTN